MEARQQSEWDTVLSSTLFMVQLGDTFSYEVTLKVYPYFLMKFASGSAQ